MNSLSTNADQLATPILWLDEQLHIHECNMAFSSWLSVGKRRLVGMSIDQLDLEAPRIKDICQRSKQYQARSQAQRLRLNFAGQLELFADALIVRELQGWRIEWHPRAEFEGADPALALPAAGGWIFWARK